MSNHDHENTPLVYSTGMGKICPMCKRPVTECLCGPKEKGKNVVSFSDDIVRVKREIKGRKGKTVTTIANVPLNNDGLQLLASELKRRCGTGGSVKDGVILIQGDRVKDVIPMLEQKGFKVKRSGG